MKKDIHPKSKKVKIIIGKDSLETSSCYSKSNEIIADIDFRTHPAWTGDMSTKASSKDLNIQNFNKKFGDVFS